MTSKELLKGIESSGIMALVLTDIIDSTVIGRRLGDAAWIQVVKKHFERARHYKAQYDGYEVKLVGDSCMIAFPTADKALRFALGLLKDTGDPSISIRAGIHVGRVQVMGNDIYGLMVNDTARVHHAMNRSGIALSAAAKAEIERQLGVKDLGKIRVLHDARLNEFRSEEHPLWEIMIPETGVLPAPISRSAQVEQWRGIAKSDGPTSDQLSQGSARRATLSQRLYGILEFENGPPTDDEVKDMIADYLLEKHS